MDISWFKSLSMYMIVVMYSYTVASRKLMVFLKELTQHWRVICIFAKKLLINSKLIVTVTMARTTASKVHVTPSWILYVSGTTLAFFKHELFNPHKGLVKSVIYFFHFQMRKLKLREIKNLFTVTEEIRGRAWFWVPAVSFNLMAFQEWLPLNTTSHRGNTNQNHGVITLHIC